MTRLTDLRDRVTLRYDPENSQDRDASVRAAEVLMHRLVEVIQPDVTIEVGAYEASFSRRCADLLPSATVIALEANPYVHDRFAPEIETASPHVRYLQVAGWCWNGTIEMRLWREEASQEVDRLRADHSLLWRNRFDARYEIVRVPTRTLDDLLYGHHLGDPAPRVALWVDVEGANGQVLKGAHDTLNATHVLVIEMERSPYWRGQLLDEEVDRELTEHGLVPVFMDLRDPYQCNVVYVRFEYLSHPTARMIIDEALEVPA